MGKPIDDSTRRMIFAMIKAGASTKAIVAKTGVSKSAINALKAKWSKGQEDVVDCVVADHTVDQTTTPTTPHARAIKGEATTPTTPDRGELAFSGLCALIDPLLSGMRLAKSIKDGKDRAIAEAQYANALLKVYSKIGSWSGLDNPAPPPVLVSPLEKFGEAMRHYSEEEDGNS